MKYIPFITLPLLFLSSDPASGALYSVFVDGVTETSGWYDVNKTFDGQDDELCWAASASNVIQWWQNKQPVIPPGTPLGDATSRYSSDIFQTFVDSFVNTGGMQYDGFTWWLTGDYDPQDYTLKPGASPAGFWSSLYPDAEVFFTNFDLDEVYARGGNAIAELSSEVVRSVDLGQALTSAIYTNAGAGHAITLWGYELDDATNQIVSFYYTDSDNVAEDGQPHMDSELQTIALDYRDGKVWLKDYYGTNDWYIGAVTSFSVTAMIPETSTATLALGGLLLWTVRRRRS